MSGITARLPLLSLAAVAVVAGAARAQTFEGSVTMHLNSARGGSDMLWSMKGDRGRMDMNGGGNPIYMIRQGDKMTIVIPAQRMYIEQAIPEGMKNPAARGGRGTPTDVQFTGKKETIAGYECEHVIVTSNDGQYDSCIAKGLGTFMMPSNPMSRGGGDDSPATAALRKLGGDVFPLKVQKVGGPVDLEVTKIEKKSLDDSMFSPPSDYRKLDVGGLFGRPPGAN